MLTLLGYEEGLQAGSLGVVPCVLVGKEHVPALLCGNEKVGLCEEYAFLCLETTAVQLCRG